MRRAPYARPIDVLCRAARDDLLIGQRLIGRAAEEDLAAIDDVEPVGDRRRTGQVGSASNSAIPIALIVITASRNRLTTAGAKPSNASSRMSR